MADDSPKYGARRLEGETDLQAWDRFVAESPQANPFSTWAWLANAGAIVGAETEIWVVTKGDVWVAGVPLTSRRLGGRWQLGLPLSAYNTVAYRPPPSSDPASVTAEHLGVTHTLIDATRGRLRNLSMMLSPTVVDVRPWTWSGWKATPRYTYVLDVTGPLRLRSSVRPSVRKCQEAGMTVDTTWDLDAFCPMFEETRERQGFAVRLSLADFRRLADALHGEGLAKMGIGRTAEGEPAAGVIQLAIPGTPVCFHWLAGTTSRHLTSGASAWLMAETAVEIGRRGHRSWDLCGADIPSVARFKGYLGGALTAYFEVDAPRGAIESAYGALKRLRRSLRRP